MCFEKSIVKIIQHPDLTDNQRKNLILKVVHHSTTRNASFQEISAVFEKCFKLAIENSSLTTTFMSLFAFSSWGEKYSAFLKEYLTVEQITQAFAEDDPTRLSIILMWMKEVMQILIADAEFISFMCPVIAGVLQSKLEDFGKCSPCLSRLAELYIFCPALLPQQNLRTSFTISIMKCVASFQTPTKPETLKHMKSIGTLITILWETLQLEDILQTLILMYSIISNTDSSVEVCPAMAHLLSLVYTQVVEKLGPRIVSDPQNPNGAFVATLTRLSTWLVAWPTAHSTLIHWIRTLVRLLYQHAGRHVVPAKVTYEQVPKLVEALRIPICRQGVMTVATIFLMSFQYSPVAFHKVIPQLILMIHCLENESSQSAKKTLHDLLLLCHGQMALFPGHPETYQPLMESLSKHPSPSDEDVQLLIQDFNWASSIRDGGSRHLYFSKGLNKLLGNYGADGSPGIYHKRQPDQKVGLRNLGNTCYMNSIIQALFMTDDFRRSVMHMSPKVNQHLLVKLQHMFSLLCFSHRSHIAPRNFHDKSRPPWFSPGMQQDCSEYLRHLMITLHEEERAGQKLPDYQERVIIESETASLASDFQPLPEDFSTVNNEDIENDFRICHEFSLSESGHDAQAKNEPECERTFYSECEFINLNTAVSNKCLDHLVMAQSSIEAQDLESTSDSMSVSAKRKHNISPMASQTPNVKMSKGEMSSSSLASETDNSSDSGISGDLAEESDLPQSSSPVSSQKGGPYLPSDKNLALEEVPNASDYFVSQVHKVFGGKISTCIKCLNCKTESIHKDVFTDINLAFQDSHLHNAASAIQKQPGRQCKSKSEVVHADLRIEDMIASYLTSEKLTGENQYECDRCGGKQDAERSIQILESPEHLILTQLRFYYDTVKMQRQKVFTNVEFGENLFLPVRHSPPFINIGEKSSNIEDKSHFMPTKEIIGSQSCFTLDEDNSNKANLGRILKLELEEGVQYDCYSLYGVVVHSGFSSEGGHYYCYARNSSVAALSADAREKLGDMGHWYNFNDETVTKTSFSSISRLTKTFTRDTAYILFYRKVLVPTPTSTLNLISEDFSALQLDLREAVEKDNLQYQSEQENELLRKAYPKLGGGQPQRRNPDQDDNPPPSSGGCGGSESMNISSRVVF